MEIQRPFYQCLKNIPLKNDFRSYLLKNSSSTPSTQKGVYNTILTYIIFFFLKTIIIKPIPSHYADNLKCKRIYD